MNNYEKLFRSTTNDPTEQIERDRNYEDVLEELSELDCELIEEYVDNEIWKNFESLEKLRHEIKKLISDLEQVPNQTYIKKRLEKIL